MIHLNTAADKTLNIVLANTNKALREVLKDISPKDLQILTKSKDLGSLLASILKETPQNETQNQALIAQLKNNPTLKTLGSVTTTIKELQQILQKEKLPVTTKLQEVLSKAVENIVNMDEKALKSKFENSGIFLESKLKPLNLSEKELKNIISNDLKAVVHKTTEDLQNSSAPHKQELIAKLDKLALQIDYYQLLSHLSNASALYIPYSFDALEDGNIKLKNAKNEKFFCDIQLQLKEYGELKLRLGLFEKNQLSININCESSALKEKLQENIAALKKSLFDAGIHPKEIHFIDETKSPAPYETAEDLQLGFEVKA